jgi:hypothetical protein
MELLTMATHTLPSSALPSPHILDDDAPQAGPMPSRKPSFMRRLYIAMLVAQHRRAQRHVDRFVGENTFNRGPLR